MSSTPTPNPTTARATAPARKGARTGAPRSYPGPNVMIAARARLAWLFREFPRIIVNLSGGKDSTLLLHLALDEAERQNRLPLPALFIDQETEWAATIEHVRRLMSDPRVAPYWLQAPLDLADATTSTGQRFTAWDPARGPDRWIRPKEPNSLHQHPTGQRDYTRAFHELITSTWPAPTAQLSGTRAEESLARRHGLTTHPTYKGITWAGRWRRNRYTFYPLYDWNAADVWHAIHELALPYNRIYDLQHAAGLPPHRMRAGSMHHETSHDHLAYAASAEPDTFAALTRLLPGAHTAATIADTYTPPAQPPAAFTDWIDYRDYLLEHLIPTEERRQELRDLFARHADRYHPRAHDDQRRTEVAIILTNDTTGQKLNAFHARHMHDRIKP